MHMNDDWGNDCGLACPQCGDDQHIDVAALVWVRLCPDGTDADISHDGSHEWDDSSNAVCWHCGFTGKVRDFSGDSR